jgi:hypothetical protein
VPESKVEKMFTIVVIIPNKATAAVKKKFIPGKGKKRSNEMIKYNMMEQ